MDHFAELFKQAVTHREQHDCSAYPYENYQQLSLIVNQSHSKRILEIGTGVGFTSVVMAKSSPTAQIDSIEKDQLHATLADTFLNEQKVNDRVRVINQIAELILPEINSAYDLIFFDGYQIHYEFLLHYQRLLNRGGILVLGNTHLSSKTSNQFFLELRANGHWQTIDQFSDTLVAKRL